MIEEEGAWLVAELERIGGRGYGAYKDLGGRSARIGGATLIFDRIQGDPFAAPSRVRVCVEGAAARLPDWAIEGGRARVATRDFLLRRLAAARRGASTKSGSGKSGALLCDEPGQAVLERSGVAIEGDALVARIEVGLPARGRRIDARAAGALLLEALPAWVEGAFEVEGADRARLRRHVEAYEDAEWLRDELEDEHLVAFIADGAVLARRSGVDDRPMEGAIAFRSPDSMRRAFDLPHRGMVEGMVIGAGVTLIVGGGYHGKSTLLDAVAAGVWSHIPGDGRELVVTSRDTLKVRAEDGRSVRGVDISAYIDELPGGRSTRAFETDDASGSTSQAASVAEGIEAGASALLFDEDTSATNFLIRDARVVRLIDRADEPITPLVARASELAGAGIALVLVVGGSGAFFEIADRVIAMRHYGARDETEAARRIAVELPERGAIRARRAWSAPGERAIELDSIDARRGRSGRTKIAVRDLSACQFGEHTIDVSALEQLVEASQLRAIARALVWGARSGGEASIAQFIGAIEERAGESGPHGFSPEQDGRRAEFRAIDVAAVLNRLRALRALGR